MDYKSFEDSEQERFLEDYYGYTETRLYMSNLSKEDYPLVRAETKKGIQAGIEDFLRTQEECETLYLSDLSGFGFDYSTEARIQQNLTSIELELENIDEYAHDVCVAYKGFVYNESRDRFEKQFGK